MKSVLNIRWKDWCWSWNSNTLATWCKELTHWKRPRCWERLKAGGERDDRGWDGWMASPTWWTWVWVNSGSWWWTGKACCSPQGHRARHDWATELNWTEAIHGMIRAILREYPFNVTSEIDILGTAPVKVTLAQMSCWEALRRNL